MKTKTNRVPHIIAGLLCSFASGLLFTWSYFREPLNALFPGWTASQLSMIFSTHHTLVAVAMILSGLISRHVTPRVRLIAGALLIGIGLGSYPFLPTDQPDTAFVLALVLFGVVAAFGTGICATTWMGTFSLWVPERPGLLTGCLFFLYGCCPFVYGALSSVLIPALGILATIRTLGLLSMVIILMGSIWARLPTPADGLPPAPPRAENKGDRSFTTVEMLKSPAFWALFIFNVAMRSAGFIFSDYSASIAISFGASALFGMLYSPANGSASFVAGVLMDRMGSAKTLRVFGVVLICGSVLLFVSGATALMPLALLGLIGAGFSFGGTSAATATAVRFFFGPDYYTQNYSTTTFSIFFASIFCYLSGIVVEKMDGSFTGIYTMTLIFGLVALACTLILGRWVQRGQRA